MSSSQHQLPSYPLRLPSYRSSHQKRHHPYPMAKRWASGGIDELMNSLSLTDDFPTATAPAQGQAVNEDPRPSSSQLSPSIQRESSDVSVNTDHFETVVRELENNTEDVPPRSLSNLVVAFARAMRTRDETALEK